MKIIMPRIKSAKKKMRQDVMRASRNARYETAIKDIMKNMKAGKKTKKVETTVSKAYSVIDKAVKMRVIHKNKGARLKGRVSRLSQSK